MPDISSPSLPSPLLHDCFQPGDGLLSLAGAVAMIVQRVQPVAAVGEVPLAEALGRVLAADVVSQATVPPCDNSAVDGYAVRHADLAAGQRRFPLSRRIAAGDPPGDSLAAGTAARIFTGAPMPPGADTVAMQEDCQVEGEEIVLPLLSAGANRRLAGEDIQAGNCVLSAGRRLRGPELAMAAAAGYLALPVRQPLRVAVFSTGDELRPPGSPLQPGQIYDSNRYGVSGCLASLGCAVTDLGLLPDDPQSIRQALAAAAPEHQLVVTSGGVSMGDEDHVKGAVQALGEIHFWRLAVKPGRPVALGQIGDCAFLGLPGNPVAALVSLMLLGRPLVAALQGRTVQPPRRYRLPAGFSFRKKPGRQEFIRCWLEEDASGAVSVQRFASQGSGVLSSMVKAEGLVDVAAETTGVAPGEMVDYLPFQDLLW